MSYQFEFTNHLTNRTEVHKVGHTVTIVQSSGLSGGILGDISDALSTRSGFKFDGKKVWDYLHDQSGRCSTISSTMLAQFLAAAA